VQQHQHLCRYNIDDGSCCVVFMLRPGLVPGSTVKREHPIHTIQLVPNTNDQLFICTNSGYAYITTISGQLVKVFTAGTLRALSIPDMQCSAVM